MARITLLRRSRALSSPAAGQIAEVVEVTYSTLAVPPRQVHLPLDLYRPATEEELAANPRYQMLPIDERAVATERKLIRADMEGIVSLAPDTFEMP